MDDAHHDAISIDLPDLTLPEHRSKPRLQNVQHADALPALIASTTARIGVGRAGPRYTTSSLLLCQGDHAITQDALMRDVAQHVLDDLDLFTVHTKITGGKPEYLLRPDLGRHLSDVGRQIIEARCIPSPQIQLVVGDGLSATAVETNVYALLPALRQEAETVGLSVGTPFFIKHCRVGVLNDIGEVLKPEVIILLIGERPGLGRAASLSAYMAYRPTAGDTDADRDVVSNIYANGGTDPARRRSVHHRPSAADDAVSRQWYEVEGGGGGERWGLRGERRRGVKPTSPCVPAGKIGWLRRHRYC
jgi:ethanolamine ammonia-lyase small subunit